MYTRTVYFEHTDSHSSQVNQQIHCYVRTGIKRKNKTKVNSIMITKVFDRPFLDLLKAFD